MAINGHLQLSNNKMPRTLVAVILYLIKPHYPKLLAIGVLIAAVGSIPAIDSFLIKKLLDFIENHSSDSVSNFSEIMLFWAIGYGCWWELINWLWRLYDYLYLSTIPRIKANTVKEYYSYVQLHSHKFFQSTLSGFITNRIVDASRSIEMILSILSEKILKKLFTLGAAIFTLYQVNPIFSNIFILWLTIFLGISGIFSKKINKLSTNWARSRSFISGKIVEAISNIASIRIYNNFDYEEKYLGKYITKMVFAEKTMNWFMLGLRYILGLSCSIMIYVMLYYLGKLRASGLITIGDFALVMTLCLAVADDIWDFSQDLGTFFEEIGTFSQSLDLLTPHFIIDNESSKEITVSNGKIEFLDVTFNYQYNDNIFEKKSIIIEPKQKVGLVGFSGSGKTTFINLITRTYDIHEGVIKIDNQDISSVSQDSLRKHICVIPQDPALFNRSILENIKYGKHSASDEEVYEAAKKAYIHDDIIKMQDQYNTLCGERGSSLSGGQRQRIAIARAVLKDAPILLLDEATSALDTITEKYIQESLNFLMKNKTVLIIAHRLSTLKNMDRILVFHKGAIIEDGTHDVLYKTGKIYRSLWESQIAGFIRSSIKS